MRSLLTALLFLGSFAHASDPGDDALQFLGRLAKGEVRLDIEGSTAITEFTSVSKRKELVRRLEIWRDELGGERAIEDVRIDGDLAAVLVRQVVRHEPMRMFGVALVRHGNGWLVSPSQSSFENTLSGYAEEQDLRRESLERWMLHEQALRVVRYHEKAREEMQKQMIAAAADGKLEKTAPAQAVERFAAACEKGDVAEVLAWLGGTADPLPEDWDALVESTTKRFGMGLAQSGYWRLLRNPSVARVVVEEGSGDRAQVVLACLEPKARADAELVRVRVIHFTVIREEGKLRIELPDILSHEEAEAGHSSMDRDMEDRFAQAWRRKHPLKVAASVEELGASVIEALDATTPGEIFDLMDLEGEYARGGCERIARLWADMQPRDEVITVPVDVLKDGDVAYWAFGSLSMKAPTAVEFTVLKMRKGEQGWLLDPDDQSDEGREKMAKGDDWRSRNEEAWALRLRTAMFAPASVLTKEMTTEAPDEESSWRVAKEWRDAMVRGNWKDVVSRSAILPDSEARKRTWAALVPMMLAAKSSGAGTLHEVTRGERWTVVRHEAQADRKRESTMIVVAGTSAGPRVVAEVDLVAGAPTSRGRKYLNEQVLDRLATGLDGKSVTELKNFFAKHCEQVEKETKKQEER